MLCIEFHVDRMQTKICRSLPHRIRPDLGQAACPVLPIPFDLIALRYVMTILVWVVSYHEVSSILSCFRKDLLSHRLLSLFPTWRDSLQEAIKLFSKFLKVCCWLASVVRPLLFLRCHLETTRGRELKCLIILYTTLKRVKILKEIFYSSLP